MEKIYFVSDAHLGLGEPEEEREKETRFLSFLDRVKKDATQIYILGDLFDAWLEFRTVIPKGFHRTLAKLDEITGSGITLHFLAGNHDFWIRDYFSGELRMKIYREPFEITANGKKIFLHHGDGLTKKDIGYRILKKLLRNRFAIWLYSWIHPDVGLNLARFSSRTSRRYSVRKYYGNEDGMMSYARAKIEEGCDFIIMGHRHQPSFLKIGRGVYINLGDWITHNTYAELDGEEIALKEWRK